MSKQLVGSFSLFRHRLFSKNFLWTRQSIIITDGQHYLKNTHFSFISTHSVWTNRRINKKLIWSSSQKINKIPILSWTTRNCATEAQNSKIRTPPVVPEFCCGNGCENCVWNIYFEELKEYEEYLKAQGKTLPSDLQAHSPTSTQLSPESEEHLQQMKDNPVGTEAFRKLEEKLAQKNKENKAEEK